jgi:hypothetical protein
MHIKNQTNVHQFVKVMSLHPSLQRQQSCQFQRLPPRSPDPLSHFLMKRLTSALPGNDVASFRHAAPATQNPKETVTKKVAENILEIAQL